MQTKKYAILVDLDGVLNEYAGYSATIPPMKKGAREFLKALKRNYKVVIFTTRNLFLTAKWLIENNLDEFIDDISNVKLPAYLHIDDRAICFDGNYEKSLDEIKNFKVYWQK